MLWFVTYKRMDGTVGSYFRFSTKELTGKTILHCVAVPPQPTPLAKAA